ncbi:MAG: hypothetical protein U5L09_20925 [Bacteroidales bacterium]|nr:hypothetical protein [Bacteroidales bacterium]
MPMPAYPFVAVVVAYYLLKQANHMLRGPFVAHLVVSLMIPVMAYVALHIEDTSITFLTWHRDFFFCRQELSLPWYCISDADFFLHFA